jgi:hypothetical protein
MSTSRQKPSARDSAPRVPHPHSHPTPPPAVSVQVLPPAEVAWTSIELPPDLPMPVFTSTDAWNDKRVGALAVYCSDGRWNQAFDEFCHRGLSIPRYDRFAVPGGPAWFAQDDRAHPELFKAAHGQIDFLVRTHALDRVVLFTHWGCGFYRERQGKGTGVAVGTGASAGTASGVNARDTWPRQLDDVRAAATTLRVWFPSVQVESYLAMRIGSQMSFHRLDPAPAAKSAEPPLAKVARAGGPTPPKIPVPAGARGR